MEAEAEHQAVGDAYYVNLANVAAIRLFTEFDEHGRHPHPAGSSITTNGAVVKFHGEAARDEMRRALERRQPSGVGGDEGLRCPPTLHLG